jgi:hypothetical protein
MKVEKEYTIYYLIHAISILDVDLLSQLLRPFANSVADKIEVAQYLCDFNRIVRDELGFDDSYFEVVHGLCEKEGRPHYSYMFTAKATRINFTLQFEETLDGMLLIKECYDETNDKQIRFSSFNGKNVEVPF